MTFRTLLSLTIILATTAVTGLAQTHEPPPGADLRALSGSAADGAIIQLAAGAYTGPIVTVGKRLTIRGAASGDSVIAASAQPLVVQVTGGGTLTLEGVTLRLDGKATLGVAAQASTVVLRRVRVRGGQVAIQAQGGDVTLDACELSDLQRTALIGVAGAGLAVTGTTFSGCKAVVLSLENAADVTVRASRFTDCAQPINVHGAGAVHIAECELSGSAGRFTMVSIHGAQKTVFERNRVVGGHGVSIDGARSEPALLRDNVMLETESAAIHIDRNGATLTNNRVYNTVSPALIADNGAAVTLDGNTFVSTTAMSVSLQNGAAAKMSGNAIVSGERALNLFKSERSASSAAGDLIAGPISESARVTMDGDALANRHAAENGDVAGGVVKVLADVLASAPDPVTRVDEITAGIDGILAGARDEAAALARIRFTVRDSVGNSDVGRFEVQTADGETVAEVNRHGDTAFVPAGEYFVAPALHDDAAEVVTVTAGQSIELTHTVEDGLLLTFVSRDGKSFTREMVVIDRDLARAKLAGLRRNDDARRVRAYPRPGVGAADVAQALTAARAAMTDLPPSTWQPGMELHRSMQRRIAWRSALRVLSLFGNAADAAALATPLKDADSLVDGMRLAAAAYIERRLGTLAKGAVLAALAAEDAGHARRAAALMSHYGSRAGDAVLIEALAEGSGSTPEQYALLGTASPAALEAFRTSESLWKVDDLHSMEPASPHHVAVPYILAHGDEDDWKRIAATDLGDLHAFWLAHVVRDPLSLMALLARHGREYLVAELQQVMRREEDGWRDSAAGLCRALLQGHAGRTRGPREANATRARFEAMRSCYDSNPIATDMFFNGRISVALPWIPESWREDHFISRLAAGQIYEEESIQIDFIPHDRLREKLDAIAEKTNPTLDLFMAAHRVASLARDGGTDLVCAGSEYRPYFFRNMKGSEGAVSGVMTFTPSMSGKALGFTLAMNLEAHYHAGLIDYNEGKLEKWPHHEYVASHGRKLLKSVRVRRGDRYFEVVELGSDTDGVFDFQATLDGASLDDLWVEVEMEWLGTTSHVVFDLFATDFARTLGLDEEGS